MKKVLLFFLIFLSIFLVSCGNSKSTEKKLIKFSNYTISLPDGFIVYPTTKKDLNLKKFTVLSSYRYKKVNKGFSPSLIILRYDGDYPADKKEFFSVIVDKFKREIVGSTILENAQMDIAGKNVYYFKYKVSDNMFDDASLNTYYGLQFYIFDKPNVYVISYVGLEQSKLNDIFEIVKNLNYKK